MDKKSKLRRKYSHEINEIYYILQNLEKGRYYEKSGARMDGSIPTNIQRLRKDFDELIDKIENHEDSVSDKIHKMIEEKGL